MRATTCLVLRLTLKATDIQASASAFLLPAYVRPVNCAMWQGPTGLEMHRRGLHAAGATLARSPDGYVNPLGKQT